MSFLAYLPPAVVERRNRRETLDTTKDARPQTKLAHAFLDAAADISGPSHRL